MSEPFAYAVVTETGRVHRLIRSEGFADEVASELRQSSTEAVDVLALYTADAIREAVEAEREACAKLAENTVCDVHLPTGIRIYGYVAARAIRARGAA